MDILELLDDDISIASLPSVYHQFQDAIACDDTSFAKIGEIILYDSGLTARLLKIVNSAYYGFPEPIEKISDAIHVVGIEQLSYLVLSTVVTDKFNSIPESVLNMESFWKHSIACGLIAKELASLKKGLEPEKFFVAGMLHDIGQVILCTKLPLLSMKILLDLQSQNEQIDILENEELDFDHAELGAKLLKKWNLSDFHIEVTSFHHKPHQAPNYSFEASLIYFADILADTMQLGSSGEKPVSSNLEEETWENLNFSEQISLFELKGKIAEAYDETLSLFLQTT
ncbi:MAG: HDOD domain-containing protein [Nitrospina sp.]|jgi:HD-like signal output (HDOD) protein|nr:HDOD domain-containing protein [Nitrospina sp.]MBT6718348.1 HDOD domain-containing protein [Nitrospina sp.]